MHTLGIVGGIGPASTVEYYRLLVSGFRERHANAYPSIVIHSVDVNEVLAMASQGRLKALADYLHASLRRLADAGANFGIMAANTPHLVFDQLQADAPIPLISIVNVTCDFAQARGLKTLGLFGTQATMTAGFYQKVFEHKGISVIIPESDDRDYVHTRYVNELVNGKFHDETRARFIDIARHMKIQHGLEGLILGGTELPLLLSDSDIPEMPLLDTTRIHVNAALDRMVEG